jgi:hypothetical protein
MEYIEKYRQVQSIAKQVHLELANTISELDSEETGNSLIENAGFQNLDFLGNLGHSIEKKSEDRRYIEKGNSSRLSDASFFTFEPHICATNSVWGFKHENIYYFNKDGILEEL